MKLVIATPSPFARKARVVLTEKAVPHDIIIDVPWNPGTTAPAHNPLGKIPILILEDGSAVYDNRVIVQYLEAACPAPTLLPEDPLDRITHLQVEALADGICDAIVLLTIETRRKPALQSADWTERQRAKVDAGVNCLAQRLGDRTWFAGDTMGLADIAAGCALGYLDVRLSDHGWRRDHPDLGAFSDRMEARASFRSSRPVAQQIAEIG